VDKKINGLRGMALMHVTGSRSVIADTMYPALSTRLATSGEAHLLFFADTGR
jgi:hypothetical protein